MKRILTLIMALILALSQCGSALAYAVGTWPDGYEADGCPSQDAALRNDGRHSYYCSEYQDPWCESGGYAVFICVYCGDTQTRTYPALGHEWGEWDEIRAATCTEEGEEIRYCNRCFQEQSRPIPALGHDWSDWYVEMEATCTESGSEFRYCNRCQTVEIRATAPLGHDWGEWRADREATCAEAGEESRFCNRCQAREERGVPALGHNWSDWKTEEPGTCVKPSLLERYCLRCGIKEWQYGPFGGHLWGEWYVSKAPTATAPGIEERVCAYDDSHREEREIPPTGQPEPSAPDPVPGAAVPPADKVDDEPDNPELTLTFLYDDPAKDVYDPDDSVFADYSLVNTGNVPLYVVAHFTSDGVTEYDYNERVFDPGRTDSSGWGWWTIRDGIIPGTETEDLLGAVTVSYYYKGLDVETGEELCRTQTITRTWKVAKPDEGPTPWGIPSLSAMSAVVEVSPGYESSDTNGYQLGEAYGTHLITMNTGDADIPAGMIHVYDPYDGFTETWYGHDFAVGETITGNSAGWNKGAVTAEDVARGFIYFPPVQFTWEDPDSGEEMTAYSNALTLNVISKTGLLVNKGIAEAPANGEYFVEGEEVKWVVTATNNSNEPVMNVTITDQGQGVGEFEKIEPGETVTCNVAASAVTEYDVLVGVVSNAAEATGYDLQKAEHTYMSNTVQVPTKAGSSVLLPPSSDPSTGTPQKGTEPTGDPTTTPGSPETPDHPGTPGGGEDPKSPIYGYNVAATLYKTTASAPKNGEYYQQGETVDYTVTMTNTGKTALENITLYDILAGFAPIGSAGGLAPGESVNFAFSYTVAQTDIDTGYVMNFAIATYAFGGGIPGTPVESNEVYVPVGENGRVPTPGGGTPGDGNTVGLIPPAHFDAEKLKGTPGGEGPVSCELQLNALGDNGADYTLHACAAHTEAARNAEAAALTGEWSKACDIWRAEIEALYETLYEAGDSEGKAAVVSDRVAFDAYVAAFRAYLGDEAAAELMRLRCAELCCMVKTASERLPESLLGDYARLMTASVDKCGREIGALDGSDATVTERYDEARAQALQEARQLADSAKYGPARENAFAHILRRWQMALDSVVNAQYKAADKETRKLIASVRVALDNVYEARKTLLGLLCADAPETAAEALSNLYKNALLDFCGK